MKILENLEEINVDKPADNIIMQIKNLISSGQLKPGDKLPSERKLSEKFGVGRTHVRDALKKLEFYGILKTLPQSGTVVAGIGVSALEGLINDVLELHHHDFYAFIETRVILETQAAQLAAQRADDTDILNIEKALNQFREQVIHGNQGVEEDIMFHLKIIEASKNSVLKSLFLIVAPDMIKLSLTWNICGDGRFKRALKEHEMIFDAIKGNDAGAANLAMSNHLSDLLEYGKKKFREFANGN